MEDLNCQRLRLLFSFCFLFCALLVIFCYFFVDQWVVHEMARLQLQSHPFPMKILMTMNQVGLIINLSTNVLIIIYGLKALCKHLTWKEKSLFMGGVTTGTAIYLKTFFKMLLGRFWPNTWYLDNPSLLKHQAYGFALWHSEYPYGAFPSGHTTITFCAMTFVWALAPRWRVLAILVCLSQVIPLIALNYHFVSDIIAGAFLGIFCALFGIGIGGLKDRAAQ